MKEEFRILFEPIRVNQLTLANRIMAAPTTPRLPEQDLCKAGVIILGCGGIDYPGAWWDTPYLFSKYERERTRKTLCEMKRGGSLVSLELMHMGLYDRVKEGAVPGPCEGFNEEGTPVRALSGPELETIAERFGKSARDARDFGFDMVMLHFAHGWLPAQFLSPAWNHRQDAFGGSYENRARFPLMILKKVREAVGADFPVDLRISAVEWIEGGIEFADTLRFLQDAQPYIDMVNISAGTDMNKKGCIHMATTSLSRPCANVEYAAEVKKHLQIPVAVVGGISTPQQAVEILRRQQADIVTLGRALIADPFWVRKVMEGREEEIVPCQRCLYCMHWASDHREVCCSVNPRYRRESLIPAEILPARSAKRVVIIGGGAAGMKAAITAKQRGHTVTLFEKRPLLGGVLHHSDHLPDKIELQRYLRYLVHEIHRLSIDVRCAHEPSREEIAALHPDVLFLAVGAHARTLPLDGVMYSMQALEAFERIDDLHGSYVIIGGGSIGCELALELDQRGCRTTILEAGDRLHRQDNLAYDLAMEERLAACSHLQIHTDALCTSITQEGVYFTDGSNSTQFVQGKAILACGMLPDQETCERYEGLAQETYRIGDCKKVGKIKETCADGTFLPYYI